jgi:RNA polymerase sigma-70 factor (ECF subfamily)
VLHNRIRGLSRAEAIPLRLAAQPISVRDFTDAAADRAQLVEAWNQLNAADQEALALTIWDGLTGIQAASVVGITRGAFAARLMRARHQLGCLLGYESTGTTDSGVNDEEPIRTIAVD